MYESTLQVSLLVNDHSIIDGSRRIPEQFTMKRVSKRVRVKCGMRNAECGKLPTGKMRKIFCGTFRILPVGYFPHSALSGGWSLHGTLAIDMYVHVHKTLFKLIFACMYNVWM